MQSHLDPFKVEIPQIIKLVKERLKPVEAKTVPAKTSFNLLQAPFQIQAITTTLFSLDHPYSKKHLQNFIEKTLLEFKIKNIVILRNLSLMNSRSSDFSFWVELTELRVGKFLTFNEYQLIAEREKFSYKLRNTQTAEEHCFFLNFFSLDALAYDADTSFRLLRLYKNSLENQEKLLIDSYQSSAANSLALSLLIFELIFYFDYIHVSQTKYLQQPLNQAPEKRKLLSRNAENLLADDIVKLVQSLRVSHPDTLANLKELDPIFRNARNLSTHAMDKPPSFKSQYPHLCHFAAFQPFFHTTVYRFFYPAPVPVPPALAIEGENDEEQQSFWRCCR